jgi:hypothetical protein
MFQGRLDILRAERAARERGGHIEIEDLAEILTSTGRADVQPDQITPAADEHEPDPDPFEAFPERRTLPDAGLSAQIARFERAEASASRKRQLLHDRIDFLLLEQARG